MDYMSYKNVGFLNWDSPKAELLMENPNMIWMRTGGTPIL
jgi:hypothetical protein